MKTSILTVLLTLAFSFGWFPASAYQNNCDCDYDCDDGAYYYNPNTCRESPEAKFDRYEGEFQRQEIINQQQEILKNQRKILKNQR